MKFLNVSADNQISHVMPIQAISHDSEQPDQLYHDPHSEFTKALIAAKGRDVTIDSAVGGCAGVIHLEDASRGYKVNGGCEALPSGARGVFLVLDRDTTISFTRPDGDVWYAHNDPFQDNGEIVLKNEPIVVPKRGLDPVTNWLLNGERGSSSEAMCWHLFGKSAEYHSNGNKDNYPYDPSDFRRCRLFVEATGCRDRIGEMANVSPTWAMYIKHWDELCEMMDTEVGWMKGDNSGLATNTFAAMQVMQYATKSEYECFLQLHLYVQAPIENSRRGMRGMNEPQRLTNSRVAMIKALVKYGKADINAAHQEGGPTPLASAVEQVVNLTGKLKSHHLAIVETLIECGADVHAPIKDTGMTIAAFALNCDPDKAGALRCAMKLDDTGDSDKRGKKMRQ